MNGSEYHRRTGYDRYAMKGHSLDWAHQPSVYKQYPSAASVCLEKARDRFGKSLGDLVRTTAGQPHEQSFGLDALSHVLTAGYGHTAEKRGPGWRFCYRSAASAGALYPAEIYVAASSVDGLSAGLYHYDPGQALLQLLRQGDAGSLLADVVPVNEFQDRCCTIFVTGIFFRSAWKYRERAYRYVLLDAGHVAENLALALKAVDCAVSVSYDFEDTTVGKLLGLDSDREVPLIAITVSGKARGAAGEIIAPADWLGASAEMVASCSVSTREVRYEEILNTHRSGIGVSSGENDMPSKMIGVRYDTSVEWMPFPVGHRREKVPDFARVVAGRRSRRNFTGRVWEENTFWSVLKTAAAAAGRSPAESYPRAASLSTGFLVGEGAPLSPGYYLLHPSGQQYGCVDRGTLNGLMADICLGQQWLANASLHFVFTADLEEMDRCCGARGYRYAMINAGRIGQLIYLAATGTGVGCCGIGAFFDSEAAQLLDLQGGRVMLYLVAVGPVKRGAGE